MTNAQKIALITEEIADNLLRIASIADPEIAHFSDATQDSLRNRRGALEDKVEKQRTQLAALKGEPPKPAKKKRTRKSG